MKSTARGADDTELGTEQLRERVAALKHDLGKYVAWTSANLEDSAWQDPARVEQALVGDLLETRTRDGVAEPAWDVWHRLSHDLPRPFDGELADVEQAVAKLRAFEPALRARNRSALVAAADQIRAAQSLIRERLRELSRRLARE